MTGASVTNKGIFYEHGKEPPLEGPPKLHLLIESNEEYRVRGFWLYILETHDFNTFRSNKQSEKLRGCLSRHLRLHCRQKCAILPVPWADTAFSRTIYCTMTMSLIMAQKSLERIIIITTLINILTIESFYEDDQLVCQWFKPNPLAFEFELERLCPDSRTRFSTSTVLLSTSRTATSIHCKLSRWLLNICAICVIGSSADSLGFEDIDSALTDSIIWVREPDRSSRWVCKSVASM